MKRFFCHIVRSLMLVSLSLLSTGNASASDQLLPSAKKKIIEFGFGNPKPEFLDRKLEMIETWMPYDGTGIDISKNVVLPSGKKVCTEYLYFSGTKFKKEWYEKDLEHLKNIHSRAKSLKYNFLYTAACGPKNEFDLFNDSFWDAVCGNYKIVAWLAKNGGCKGFVLDIEDYGSLQRWRYRPSCGHTYREAWDKARERGRQWMNAVASEYPDVTLFTYFWLDLAMGAADGLPLLFERLESNRNGLLIAFINGIYDVLPQNAKIVDGMENQGYGARNIDSYYRLRALRELRFPRMLTEENRKKFFEQSSLAVSTFIDCYVNTNPPYSFRKAMLAENMSPVEFFRRNFTIAVNFSDEYVWTWRENRKWYPDRFPYAWQEKRTLQSPSVPGPYVGMAIPGIEEAICYARDPWGYSLSKIKNGKLKNLLQNPNFDELSGKAAVGLAPGSVVHKNMPCWETWKHKRSKATIALAPRQGITGNAAVIKDGSGVIHQPVRINPNGAYIIRASAKYSGNSGAVLEVRWRDKKGSWNNQMMRASAPFSEDIGNGWRRAMIVVSEVPQNSVFLCPLLNSTSDESGSVLFDNVEVYSLFEDKPTVAPHLREELKKWQKNYAASQAAQIKDEKKSPSVQGNKVTNGNFQKRGGVISGYTLQEGILFKPNCEAYPSRGPRKPRFFCVVGKGAGYADDSAGAIVGGNGCMVFHVRGVKPGQKYRVRARAKVIGSGTPELRIYWSSKQVKNPFDFKLGIPKFAFSQKDKNGWMTAEGEITVLENATKFALIPAATGVVGEKDRVFFDDLEAVPVP